MHKKQKEQIRSRIEELMALTKEELAALKEKTQPIEPDVSLGGVTLNEKALNDHLIAQADMKLEKLHYALSHLGDKGFGRCIECKETIPFERLLLSPDTLKCIACLKKEEV